MPQESEQSIVQIVRAREVVGTVHNLELLESMVVALSAAGFDKSDIDRAEDMYRARDKERLRLQIEAGGDMRAARADVAQQVPWGNGK